MRVTGVILAGGKGTRFRPYSEFIAKPMLPVDERGTPLIEFIVRWLARHGVRDLVVLVGHLSGQVVGYLGDGGRLGVRVRYSEDDEEYGGTGGALLKAYRLGLLEGDAALVWYGDIIAEVDVSSVLRAHGEAGAHATLVVSDRYQLPVGVARLDRDGSVVGLEEKPWLPIHATIGVLALDPSVLRDAGELGTRFDLMGDLVPWMIRRGLRVKAYIHEGPWYDVGSLERYVKLDRSLFPRFFTR
ncbi:hypothetical protein JCM10135_12420 [Stetteria hydrogenophila]